MTIGNTGDGIPKERVGLLFQRFCRVRGGGPHARPWLALSTARELARAHGGNVELVRSAGNWTEMRVRLLQAA
jgi:signal transduction histidine kinase